jgi:putative transposase
MKKLDPVKVAWIIKQKEKGENNNYVIAGAMKISTRWVQALWSRYRKTETVPELGKPGRPRKEISAEEVKVVVDAFGIYKLGAVCLEKIIDAKFNIHIPHNTIHRILKQKGLAMEESRKRNRRKWIRYERTYSNSLWHTDYKQVPDGRWFIAYEDDASRYVVSYGVFDEATSKNAVDVLKEAIARNGKPASILSDRGSQFYASESEVREKGLTEFELFLIANDIKHIVGRVSHPQTNGKIERIYGEVERKLHLFKDIHELVDWYNNIRPHMSLDWDNLETPSQAYVRKMPPDGVVVDEQSGEMYEAKKEQGAK